MLSPSLAARAPRHRSQRGIVLLVALVVLVAITIAGIAMMRSVDTATLVAGNLAFQQAATHASDKGVEEAIQMLRQKATDETLHENDPTRGYFATLKQEDNPAAGVGWQQFWQDSLAASAFALYDGAPDDQGNRISFVVHRQCAFASPPGAGGQCVASPAVTQAKGNSQEAGEVQLQSASQIYYRITVRVSGPRKTESYVQSHVAM